MQQKPPFDLNDFRPPNVSKRLVRMVILIVVGLIFVYSTFFTIGPEEVGVVLRFGKYNRTVGPGLSFKLPLGIETLTKVPVQRQLKEEFGFRTAEAGVRTRYATRSYDEESLMLTGDLNIAEVEWVVQFRISDAYRYLFRVRNAIQTFRDMNEAVMREVVGDRTINEVLNIRQEVETAVAAKLQNLCNQYELGLKVEQVQLQDVTPPDPVKPAFNEVNEAQQEREKLINQAQAEYNRVIPKAKGEAQRTIEEAEGYATERVNNAQGDVSKFNALLREYMRAPEVTRQRIYLETMSRVLPKVGRKLVIDEKATGLLPLFNIDQGGVKK